MTATDVRPVAPGAPTTPPPGFPPPPPASAEATRRFSLLDVGRLPADVYESRHRMLIAILAVHVPLLLLLGVDVHDVAFAAELALPALLGVLGGRFLTDHVGRAVSVVFGLCFTSYAVVHLSGGAPEAHLHPLFVVALVALYQEPLLLAGAVGALVLSLVAPTVVDPALVYAPGAALRKPWLWTLIHAVALVGVAFAAALQWRRDVPVPVFADPAPPLEAAVPPPPTPEVVEHIERARAAELALTRRQATYALMTNLARRNQSLIGRQLSTLDDLERDERDPDVLAGLFALDHLATRMRRNAENLLVLAGAPGQTSRISQPVPVEELLRGAAAEVEQYARVDVQVGASASVAGHAVSDVAHLLAELLDNALACSPPDTQVVVGAAPGIDGDLRLWVADEGIGMTGARLAEHNALLSQAEEELEVGATLGFPVVKRLAARHHIRVVLGAREGGAGLVAYVDLPVDIVVTDAGIELPVPSSAVPVGGAGVPTALPGRRAARRVTDTDGNRRRNELARDAAAENWFHPAPMPEEGEEVEALWSPEPAGLPEPVAPATPLATDPDALPTRTVRGNRPAVEHDVTAPIDVAALRATLAAEDASDGDPLLPAFVPAPAHEQAEPAVPVAPTYDPTPVPAPTFEPAPVFEPASLTEAAPAFEPASAVEPATTEIPVPAEPMVPWQQEPAAAAPAPIDQTVVPSARPSLARRVPQQALREAGGLPTPQTFHPGPATDAAAAPPQPAPDPGRSSDVLASYRAGLARARQGAGAADTASTVVEEKGPGA